ncbi:hypothetical protein LR48_Vigan503s002200 [Vigna angularis]|uniref:Uncharacterized protein n=1 Tax=Phaseolus angularis TaxID=3914 RepID=A0A0L9TC97_PHAAN|nr:hypothetical protein LR48_Vigan503s002200 [Vigna angularis]
MRNITLGRIQQEPEFVIVEALKVDNLQKLCSSLEPILRRVVRQLASYYFLTQIFVIYFSFLHVYCLVGGMSCCWLCICITGIF